MFNKYSALLKGFLAILILSVALVKVSSTEAENLTITLKASEYQIINGDKGQRIEMEGFGYLMRPGKPMLPAKNFLIALPPGAWVQSVEVKGIGPTQLPGTYRILPAPPIMPMADLHQYPQCVERMQGEWQRNNETVYASNQAYPKERGKLTGSGGLRKYSYASVSFCPFSYHPQSGKLIHYDAAQVTINYSLPSPSGLEAERVGKLKWDTVADERASRLFVNYQQVKDLYRPKGVRPQALLQPHDYVIITTSALSGAITSSNFVSWKTSLGYNVRIVLTTDTEITSQPGSDLAEKIRNFLRSYYSTWSIEYVLLVGDYATIPMRYCYPDPTNHTNNAGTPNASSGEVPTDYYYADLSNSDAASWDSDGDTFYGEYGQDSPDFLAEVYVGRIPTNNNTQITTTLNKLVTFEQDTGTWKDQALHAGAILWYDNEDYQGYWGVTDGAYCMALIESNFMSGWPISHYSEQAGLAPSSYAWSALGEAAFTNDWRNGQYGVVNWIGHGWSNSASRKVWLWDDGDNVPESHEMSWYDFINTFSNLDDDHPSIVFAMSCLVGYPEPNGWGRLGVDLLTASPFGSSAGVVSASRISWGVMGWVLAWGGGESMCYEFNHYMINGPSGPEKVGDALYDSKLYCNQNYGWASYHEYWNMYDFNLYGDPALVREGIPFGSPQFIRGDIDASGGYTLGDGLFFLNFFFTGLPIPGCMEACDVDDSGNLTLADGLWFLNYFFTSSPVIPPPSPGCGIDPTPDALGCLSFPPCGTKSRVVASAPLVSVKGASEKVIVRDAEIKDGEVVVPVELVNVEDITGVDITLGYDASALEAEKIEGGEGYDYFVGYTADAGKVRIGIVPDLEMRDVIRAGERVIAEVVFKAKGSLSSDVKITVERVDLYGRGVKQVKSEWVDGLVKAGAGLPTEFALSQNYPNPFNPTTLIRYDLPVDCQVRLDVYNVVGQRIATVVDGHQKAGYKLVSWNVRDMASGVYFYRLTAGDFTSIRKMVFLR